MLAPTMPTLKPSVFSPGFPEPPKIVSLMGSWKLWVPRKMGRFATANGAASRVPVAPVSVKLVTAPTVW